MDPHISRGGPVITKSSTILIHSIEDFAQARGALASFPNGVPRRPSAEPERRSSVRRQEDAFDSSAGYTGSAADSWRGNQTKRTRVGLKATESDTHRSGNQRWPHPPVSPRFEGGLELDLRPSAAAGTDQRPRPPGVQPLSAARDGPHTPTPELGARHLPSGRISGSRAPAGSEDESACCGAGSRIC